MRVLDTTLSFYRNVSTKHCIAKGPEICSLLNNWSVCSSSLSLIKRTFCSPLTSAKTSFRELGKKKKNNLSNVVSYHRCLSQIYWRLSHFKKWFHSFRPESPGDLASWKLPQEGIQPSLNHLRSWLTDFLCPLLQSPDSVGWGGYSNIYFLKWPQVILSQSKLWLWRQVCFIEMESTTV